MNQLSELFNDAVAIVVIVPNFNGLEHLLECLTSLFNQSYKKLKIILVDDCSTDNSINFVKNNFPNIDILALSCNQGFAKAVNLAIVYAREKYQPKYLAIINNDTKADKDWLRRLVVAIELEKNIVAVASNMFFYDRPEIINSQGGKFTFNGYGLDINFNKRFSEIKNTQKYILASCWGATLIKNEAFDIVGLLDESYYSYFEDLDWGYRANLLGYKIIFEPSAVVYHKGSATWKKYQFKKIFLCRRNSLYTILKNYEFKNIVKSFPLIFFDYFVLYCLGYLFNIKLENGRLIPLFSQKELFIKRFKFLIIPFLSFYYSLINLPKIIKLRRKIQPMRRVPDKEIFRLSKKS